MVRWPAELGLKEGALKHAPRPIGAWAWLVTGPSQVCQVGVAYGAFGFGL